VLPIGTVPASLLNYFRLSFSVTTDQAVQYPNGRAVPDMAGLIRMSMGKLSANICLPTSPYAAFATGACK
jgi:hypothetical protein